MASWVLTPESVGKFVNGVAKINRRVLTVGQTQLGFGWPGHGQWVWKGREMLIIEGDRKMYLPAQWEQRVLSLLTAWSSRFSSSYQLNLISDLRSFKQRPIFKNWSAVAMPFLASQKWKAIVAHLPQSRAMQVWSVNGRQLCCTSDLRLIISVLRAWN